MRAKAVFQVVVALSALSATLRLQAAPGDVLFYDNLNGNLNDWTVVRGVGDASIGNETSQQGRALRLRWGVVSVTSDPFNASVPAVRFDVWIRRGADSFSEDPDGNENLILEYLNDAGSWIQLQTFAGNGTPGQIYTPSYILPADALHGALQLRFRMTGNDGSDWDYWHVDDPTVTEVAPALPFGLGGCEDFEGGLSNWTILSNGGGAGISNATSNSPTTALFTRWGRVTVTSNSIDLDGAASVDLTTWIRRGADSFSENPENNENLVVEYLDDGGSWVALETFTGGGTAGEIFAPSYPLPASALHAGFQVRFRQTRGSGSDWDYWHIDDVCLTTNIQASYQFEESDWTGAAGEVLDAGPNSLNGTVSGGAGNAGSDPAITGNPGTCRYADFDGVDDFIQVPDNSAFDLSTALTVGAWVNARSLPSGGGLHTIVSKDTNYEFHINSSGQIYYWWNDAGGTTRNITSSASISPNQWHHVAITYRSGAQSVYLDGSRVASSSYSGNLRLNDLPFFIGTDYNFIARAWDGYLDEVNVFNRAFSQAEVQALMIQTHPCANVAPQFTINHDTFGINCLAETITVDVVDAAAGTPLTDYNATVVLDTQSGRGTWQLVTGSGPFADTTVNDGLASYDWPLTETQAVFQLSYPEGPPSLDLDVYQQSDPGIRDTDAEGALVFSANGFTLTAAPLSNPPPAVITPFAATQTAAIDFPMYIAAYGQTSTDPQCGVIESYTGNKTLKFWSSYVDPGFGSMNMSVDGGAIATVEASAAAQAVVFNNGQAAVTSRYDDVGVMQILVKDDTTINADLPTGIRGATASFVVQPADFVISNIRAGATINPQAADASGGVFIAAGAGFQATVTAVDAQGDPTPNYGQESNAEGVRFNVNLLAPGGGSAPAVSAAVGLGAFAGGSATGFDFVWPEVGIIELVPGVFDGDYLGSGDVTGSPSERVGRFVPDHFAVATNTPMFQTACVAGGFSYLGENFNYLVVPVITLTAQAVGNTTTLNYTGDFFKLDTPFMQNRVYQPAAGTLDLSGVPLPTADPTVVPSGPGVGTATFSGGGGFAFNRIAPLAPFDADIDLSIDVFDADGVAAVGTTVTFPSISFSAGANMRYGRIAVNNAVGSERVNLPVKMTAQYFAGSGIGFVTNIDDSCANNITLSFGGFTENLVAGDTCVLDSGAPGDSNEGCAAAAPLAVRYNEPPVAGDFSLNLQAPDPGNNGSLLIQALVPAWLTFDWNTASPGEENPTGQATFGIFQGNSQQIYLREVY